MSMMKWKDAEDLLRSEGNKFGFAQMKRACTDGTVRCDYSRDGLMVDVNQLRAWAVAHTAGRRQHHAKTATPVDCSEQLRRLNETLERIETMLKS